LTKLLKGDIVKITAENTDKLGLISEVVDDTMIRVGKNWYLLEEFEIELLHRELTSTL
jgi:hypothetical protein